MLSVETQGNSINVTFLYNKIEVSYKVKISFLPGLRILFGLLPKYIYICKQSIIKL